VAVGDGRLDREDGGHGPYSTPCRNGAPDVARPRSRSSLVPPRDCLPDCPPCLRPWSSMPPTGICPPSASLPRHPQRRRDRGRPGDLRVSRRTSSPLPGPRRRGLCRCTRPSCSTRLPGTRSRPVLARLPACRAWLPPKRADWDTAARDGRGGGQPLRTEEGVDTVGLLGFCYGGGLAFNVAALTDVDALVSYYGSALPRLLDLAPQVTAPQLHHWGTEDSFIDGPTRRRAERSRPVPGAGSVGGARRGGPRVRQHRGRTSTMRRRARPPGP
jgi:hypothetical protein